MTSAITKALSDPDRRAEPKSIHLHFDSMTSANSHK